MLNPSSDNAERPFSRISVADESYSNKLTFNKTSSTRNHKQEFVLDGIKYAKNQKSINFVRDKIEKFYNTDFRDINFMNSGAITSDRFKWVDRPSFTPTERRLHELNTSQQSKDSFSPDDQELINGFVKQIKDKDIEFKRELAMILQREINMKQKNSSVQINYDKALTLYNKKESPTRIRNPQAYQNPIKINTEIEPKPNHSKIANISPSTMKGTFSKGYAIESFFTAKENDLHNNSVDNNGNLSYNSDFSAEKHLNISKDLRIYTEQDSNSLTNIKHNKGFEEIYEKALEGLKKHPTSLKNQFRMPFKRNAITPARLQSRKLDSQTSKTAPNALFDGNKTELPAKKLETRFPSVKISRNKSPLSIKTNDFIKPRDISAPHARPISVQARAREKDGNSPSNIFYSPSNKNPFQKKGNTPPIIKVSKDESEVQNLTSFIPQSNIVRNSAVRQSKENQTKKVAVIEEAKIIEESPKADLFPIKFTKSHHQNNSATNHKKVEPTPPKFRTEQPKKYEANIRFKSTKKPEPQAKPINYEKQDDIAKKKIILLNESAKSPNQDVGDQSKDVIQEEEVQEDIDSFQPNVDVRVPGSKDEFFQCTSLTRISNYDDTSLMSKNPSGINVKGDSNLASNILKTSQDFIPRQLSYDDDFRSSSQHQGITHTGSNFQEYPSFNDKSKTTFSNPTNTPNDDILGVSQKKNTYETREEFDEKDNSFIGEGAEFPIVSQKGHVGNIVLGDEDLFFSIGEPSNSNPHDSIEKPRSKAKLNDRELMVRGTFDPQVYKESEELEDLDDL